MYTSAMTSLRSCYRSGLSCFCVRARTSRVCALFALVCQCASKFMRVCVSIRLRIRTSSVCDKSLPQPLEFNPSNTNAYRMQLRRYEAYWVGGGSSIERGAWLDQRGRGRTRRAIAPLFPQESIGRLWWP